MVHLCIGEGMDSIAVVGLEELKWNLVYCLLFNFIASYPLRLE